MTTNTQSTFQNDHIHVTVKREPGCKILLEVSVTPEASQASYQKAIALIRKDVSVPGFRKGKAPEAMILQNYEKHVEREWKDLLLNTALEDAIKLTQIFPFNRNSVKTASLKSASRQDGSLAFFEYEAAPEVPLVSPETLSIAAVELKPVTQQDIDDSIEDLSLQSAEWTDVVDRPAQDGDFVVIDIDAIGESPRNICSQQLFSLKQGKMGQWIHKAIVGLTIGQTVEAISEKEQHDEDCDACEEGTDHHKEDVSFIPTLCRITLNAIREAKPHPLSDELAKKYGAKHLQDLYEKIKFNLKKRASDEQKDQQRQLMEKELLTHYPFDMPASLIQNELKAAKKAAIDKLRNEGLEETKIATEARKIEAEAAYKYDRDFRLYFLTQKFAREHDIQVSQDEVALELMRQMWLKQMGHNNMDPSIDQKERESETRLQLLAVKAIDQMIEKAQKLPKKP